MLNLGSWIVWALLSALFAALTAVFAKVGVKGVDSDLATAIRTGIVFLVLIPFVWLTGKWSNPLEQSPRTLLFLGLSALATGASWLCYFRALQLGKVKPLSKGEIGARTGGTGYKPDSPETQRAWRYWAERAGCADLLKQLS